MTQSSGIDGQRVLVTAAATGIGLAIAEAFVDAGARVYVCDVDRDAVAKLERRQIGMHVRVTDVSQPDDIDDLFDDIESRFRALDVLINNAGVGGPIGPLEKVPQAEWRQTLEVNLFGAYGCCRRAIPLMKKARGGSIINLSSTAGVYGVPNRTPYVASKWGLIGLTKSLASELGGAQIRVNAICPGSVEGDRIERVLAAEAKARGTSENTVRKEFVDSNSMKVFIGKEDVAALAVFLCSDQGRYISGQAIGLDGNTEVKW